MRIAAVLLWFVGLSISLFAQDFARKQLEDSPRHHEWVDVPAGADSVFCFLAFPEKSEKTLAVMVLHENRGLTDWVGSFADQLAAAGYLAIAPDLLSHFDETHRRTSDFPSSEAARQAIYQLDPERVTRYLRGVQKYVSALPAANGTVAVMGFCWGGSQTFQYATHAPDISAALVFYGTAPDDSARLGAISAPVYGFYGENDERVNATIPRTEKWMRKLGKTYQYVIYPGAGHAFMRRGEEPGGSPENHQAREAAWQRLREILSGIE